MRTTNTITRVTGIAFLLCAFMTVSAQKRIGDFIESKSYNDEKRGTERTLQYYPEDDAFVCVNGKNRYTRALYGGYTEYRVETSDRPIFAIFKKKEHRNVSMELIYKGESFPLEETDYCKARYANGTRSYELRHGAWGEGRLSITVVALVDTEGAIWKFTKKGFTDSVKLKVNVCGIANTKLHRNGDMGADMPGSFDPSPDKEGLESREWVTSDVSYFGMEGSSFTEPTADLAEIFSQTERRNKEMAQRVVFTTPDPYINTLGGALVMAADGDWDGKTWLHGCVGWRMPLAGWRAGYLGDVLGWNDRAVSHFDAYAKSQVIDVVPSIPHPSQDPATHLARAKKKWGTQMYSNGYICRNPERNDQMHHYDMNLNYMDELLWHFCYDADTVYMRRMWNVIKSHLAWEKRNFDPDDDGLYDGYCCIWASDALYYNGGAVTHSSAYNYRGNLLAARIAEIIGEDSAPYETEATRILDAMNRRLWLDDKRHWVEYEDLMGLKRKHESAAVWSIYTPIDCGAGSSEQFYNATRYIDQMIPHIPVMADGEYYGSTLSTSNWMPYSWSINNVAAAEVMHTALAYFEAGRADAGYELMKANIMDQMYLGDSPANFGQISFYDAARGECYRDFGDCIGISARTLIQGLFGIVPDALHGRCVIHPGFPSSWDSASVKTPYIIYAFKQENGKIVYDITQDFSRPLKIVIRQDIGNGKFIEIEGTTERHQVITTDIPAWFDEKPTKENLQLTVDAERYGLGEPMTGKAFKKVDIDKYFNSEVDDIYKNEYLSPRPPYTTLQIPTQGIGEWCHPSLTADVNDSVFRSLIIKDEFTVANVPFRTPSEGRNIIYTSLWDNYPDSVCVPLKDKASTAYLLMAGSTNHMQCRIDNGIVVATYQDGTTDTLHLVNPDNWCPIEQDFFVDGKAFYTTQPRPYRVALGSGLVSRDLGKELGISEVYGRPIPGGAAQLLKMPLDNKKKLKSLTIRTLSNDVVIGLMGITLQ